MKKFFLLFSFSVASMFAMENNEDGGTWRRTEFPMRVVTDGQHFFLQEPNSTVLIPVQDHYVDPTLKKIKHDQWHKFNEFGYIEAKKLSNDEYKLNANLRLRGGGPTTAWCAYVGTRIVGYGTFAGACFFDPHLVIHYQEAQMAIEAAAQAAGYLGAISPTP